MSTKQERRQRRFEEMHQLNANGAEDREKRFEEIGLRQKRSRLKTKIWLFGGLALLAALLIGVFINDTIAAAQPGRYDSFTKCLTEKGAVMYGAIEWCEYTKAQAKMFGNSFKYIEYRNYEKLPGIRRTPTWEINGERHEGVQSFERLSSLTGCKIDQ